MNKQVPTNDNLIPWPPGISGYVSAPTTYSVLYPGTGQTISYTEAFAVLQAEKWLMDQLNGAIDGFLATLVATGPLSDAVGGLIEIVKDAAKWFLLNDDGSLKILLAYHYAGAGKLAIDPTAWGLFAPNISPSVWDPIVNGIQAGINVLNHVPVPQLAVIEMKETIPNSAAAIPIAKVTAMLKEKVAKLRQNA